MRMMLGTFKSPQRYVWSFAHGGPPRRSTSICAWHQASEISLAITNLFSICRKTSKHRRERVLLRCMKDRINLIHGFYSKTFCVKATIEGSDFNIPR